MFSFALTVSEETSITTLSKNKNKNENDSWGAMYCMHNSSFILGRCMSETLTRWYMEKKKRISNILFYFQCSPSRWKQILTGVTPNCKRELLWRYDYNSCGWGQTQNCSLSRRFMPVNLIVNIGSVCVTASYMSATEPIRRLPTSIIALPDSL